MNFKSPLFFIIFGTLLTFLYQNCGTETFDANKENASELSSSVNDTITPATSEDRVRSFRRLSVIFLQKNPSLEDLEKAADKEAYEQMVDEIIDSTLFLDTVRSYHQRYFELEGSQEDVNFNEPANLAAYLITNNLDFREILRANFCVDDNLETAPCSAFDSDQDLTDDFSAGVITTQAFLSNWNSSFAFARTRETFKQFACSQYPDTKDPGLEATDISNSIKGFGSTDPEENCYSCHRTMNPRTALFYAFDINGQYNLNPTTAESIKTDTGARSSLEDLLVDGATPVYKGEVVNTLKEYAFKLSESDEFSDCLSKRLTLLALGSESTLETLPSQLNNVSDIIESEDFKVKDFYRNLFRSDAYVRQ